MSNIALVHGLFLHRVVMLPLAYSLQRKGFVVDCFGYRSTARSFDEHVTTFHEWLIKHQKPPYQIVGHSMGALLALAVAERCAQRGEQGHLIALTPPFCGSKTGRSLAQYSLGRRMLGKAVDLWAERATPPSAPDRWNVTVVRGTRMCGAGMFICSLRAPHDGTVSVCEMEIQGAHTVIDMPVTHTGVIYSLAVSRLIAEAFSR